MAHKVVLILYGYVQYFTHCMEDSTTLVHTVLARLTTGSTLNGSNYYLCYMLSTSPTVWQTVLKTALLILSSKTFGMNWMDDCQLSV
jgi:hypothetical protein